MFILIILVEIIIFQVLSSFLSLLSSLFSLSLFLSLSLSLFLSLFLSLSPFQHLIILVEIIVFQVPPSFSFFPSLSLSLSLSLFSFFLSLSLSLSFSLFFPSLSPLSLPPSLRFSNRSLFLPSLPSSSEKQCLGICMGSHNKDFIAKKEVTSLAMGHPGASLKVFLFCFVLFVCFFFCYFFFVIFQFISLCKSSFSHHNPKQNTTLKPKPYNQKTKGFHSHKMVRGG